MKLAIIKTGGKQYKVAVGDVVAIEKISGEAGSKVTFDEVLFLGDEQEAKIGDPVVKDAKVEAEIVEQTRAKKVTGIKHKAKKRQLKKFGHKQQLTKVKIISVK